MPSIDWLILTAANPIQARGYNAQMQARKSQGLLGDVANWRVIPDPRGRRVGSGGSTLWVLHELARSLLGRKPDAKHGAKNIADLFAGQRILVIHSGGDSRRLCAYAAQGKVFTPLPCPTRTGTPATLFDLILANLLALPAPAGGQVLLAAGDVLLTFDPQAVDFTKPGVVGVAYPGPIDRGSKHGVYITDRDGAVVDFLQKPDAATARSRHAVDAVGRVLVDTGLVSLDPPSVQAWLKAGGVSLSGKRLSIGKGLLRDVLAGKTPPVDLYEQVLMAMPEKLDREAYLNAVMGSAGRPAERAAHRRRLAHFHRCLHRHPFHANVLPYCDFFHIGTSRELLTNVNALGRTATAYRFANFHRAVVADRAALEGSFVHNTIVSDPRTHTGQGVFLEAVNARGPVELPGQNIVVGWPAKARTPLRLPADWGVVCLPLRGTDWSVVLFGVDDDFKTPWARGGTLGNRPLPEFLARHGVDPASVWPDRDPAKQTLWEARLWSVGPIDAVLRQTLWLCDERSRGIPAGWLEAPRVSMEMLIKRVDHQRLIAHRLEIQRQSDLHELGQRLLDEPWLPAAAVIASLHHADEATLALDQLARVIATHDEPLLHARLYRLADLIRQRFPLAGQTGSRSAGSRRSASAGKAVPKLPADADQASAAAIARAVAQSIELPDQPRKAAVLPDQAVWVTTPVRLDFAGGWSDTPPICTELGGAVLNAAITLNGQYPVQVMAKLRDDPVVSLNSIDLGRHITLTDTAAIHDHRDTSDWAALPKAALMLAGICPRDPQAKLAKWLDKLGGGIDITLFSALPKGSGLGTSSVLGAAMLACLARIVGENLSAERLIARTSLLEQLMTTGGGWQDQVGGVTPGIKLVRTRPGPDQTPSLQWTVFDRSAGNPFRNQLLLYYTGYRRLAKHILRNVVNRYLARDPEALEVITRLKAGAEKMKASLDERDFAAVGRGVEDYWTLKKRFDPGSTNPTIEALLRRVQGDLIGKLLPGAGGGGFVFMVARDEAAAQRVRRTLEANPPNPLARFFDFDIDPHGLKVTVL
ncbi:MAG: hypothetical protein NTW19_10950 [Planctomycetota bacterium]|nr:hypothetical protein [Planctomycetota bacterium]